MKGSPESRTILPMVLVVFFLSVIIILGIMEFRFAKIILVNYEDDIKQVALNKTAILLNDLKAVSENAAKKMEVRSENVDETLRAISTYDYRIVNVYLIGPDGSIRNSLSAKHPSGYVDSLFADLIQGKSGDKVMLSGVYTDESSHLKIVSTVVPLGRGGPYAALALDFRMDIYQKEMLQEFLSERYKIALFDHNAYPVFWPFDREKLDGFRGEQAKFYDSRDEYNVLAGETGQPPWKLYFFFKENNFETLRTITILFLVFVLYCCLYQLLVEFWGVNSVKTYFENIDFAIFNKINEGVILTNNSGRIIFANSAAHEIFADRKSTLTDIRLKEILGNIEGVNEDGQNASAFTLKMPDRLLEAIHSPIIKKGKKLGSLTVIRVNVKEERTFKNVLKKLFDIIPEGAVFVDKNHEVALANLMARCYLGNLEKGTSIDVVDPALASFIYENIGSGSVKRMEMADRNLSCEIVPVYDDDGVYAGTLVVLPTPDDGATSLEGKL